MIYKIIALTIILLLLVTDYALMVVAKNAEEKAERIYKTWRDNRNDMD